MRLRVAPLLPLIPPHVLLAACDGGAGPDGPDITRATLQATDAGADTEWGVWSQDGDWVHANSLHVGPRGNVVMSLRNISQVISIAPHFGSVEWRLGGIGSPELEASGDFTFDDPADRFILEHTASIVSEPGGLTRVLVFDNGWGDRAYSRALELELDHDAGRTRSVWEFQPTPPN